MAKGLRSSTRKANNQRLKNNVFGPVEAARAERLSAKLMELANQPKPQHDTDMKTDDMASDDGVDSAKQLNEGTEMEVDSKKTTLTASQVALKKKIEKRKKFKSRITFPKYKERKVRGKH